MRDEDKLTLAQINPSELVPTSTTEEHRAVLKEESSKLLAQLTHEKNPDRFAQIMTEVNINHSKKAMLRQERLDALLDKLVDETLDRVTNHADEFDNDMLNRTLTTVQTVMEKNSNQTEAQKQQILIDVKNTETNININHDQQSTGLSSNERKNVSNFLAGLFQNKGATDNTIEIPVEEKVVIPNDK